MINRRAFVAGVPAAWLLSNLVQASDQPSDQPSDQASLEHSGLKNSDLIYVSPLRTDGEESRCQGEVWFQLHNEALYVVTASSAWRARAPQLGLSKARVWVGDVGVWTDSDGRYRQLPAMDMTAELVANTDDHEAVLDKMGDKYTLEWIVWGPRFRDGLADGSRVMLRYS